jgi:hypothetical protein
MQTIEVRYVGPTSTCGSRVVATASSTPGRVVLGFHSGSGTSETSIYDEAAALLMKKLGWKGRLARGSTRRGDYVYVFVPESDRELIRVDDPRRGRGRRPSRSRARPHRRRRARRPDPTDLVLAHRRPRGWRAP